MENLVINRGNPRRVEIAVLGANGVQVELSRCTDVELVLWINGRSKRAQSVQVANDILIAELSASELDYLGEYSAQVKFAFADGEKYATERVYLFRVANEFFRTASGMSENQSMTINISAPLVTYDRQAVEDMINATQDAIESTANANNAAMNAEAKATLAQNNANLANAAATTANSSAVNADNKAALAVTATANANTATSNANTATTNANNAATNANAKATLANTAATNATNAANYTKGVGDSYEARMVQLEQELNGNPFIYNGKWLKIDGSVVSDNPLSCITDYIEIFRNNNIVIIGLGGNSNTVIGCFYDKDFKFIAPIICDVFGEQRRVVLNSEIPSNAVYLRACANIDQSGKTVSYTSLFDQVKQINETKETTYKSELLLNDIDAYIIDSNLNSPPFNRKGKAGLDSIATYDSTELIYLKNVTCIEYNLLIKTGGCIWLYDKNKKPIASTATPNDGVKSYGTLPITSLPVKAEYMSAHTMNSNHPYYISNYNAYININRDVDIAPIQGLLQGGLSIAQDANYGNFVPDVPNRLATGFFKSVKINKLILPTGYTGFAFYYDSSYQAVYKTDYMSEIIIDVSKGVYIKFGIKKSDDSNITPSDVDLTTKSKLYSNVSVDYNGVIELERGVILDDGQLSNSDNNIMSKYRSLLYKANGIYIFAYNCDIYVYSNDGDFIKKIAYINNNSIRLQDCMIRLSAASNIIKYNGNLLTVSKYSIPSLTPKRFYFGVDYENLNNNTTISTYDQLRLLLPPNYDANGSPVRLIIFCHGSGGYLWGSTDMGYKEQMLYLAKEGYAVAHICGISKHYYDKYYTGNDGDSRTMDGMGTPSQVACYKQGYEWIYKHFNIKKDVFIFGKSLGGALCGSLQYTSGIPIIASGGLSPTIDTVAEIMRNRPLLHKKYYLDAFGIGITVSDSDIQNELTPAGNVFIKENANKIVGYNPMWNGIINLDTDSMLDMFFKYPRVSTGVEYSDWRTLFESMSKNNPVPYKIWIAVDDVNVDPRICDYLQKMSYHGSGVYKLRWMPANTGGHWAVDSDPNALKSTIVTKYGGSVTVATAYAEMVSFFKSFD